jgi:hypothetical protein
VYLCALYGSRTNRKYFYLRNNWLVFITETVSIYCAVRTESLNIITVNLRFYRVNSHSQLTDWFLGAFVKSRKGTISFVTSVCLSVLSVRPSVCLTVHLQQLISHWTGFQEILYLSVFRKSVAKIQIWLKYDNNNWYFNPLNTKRRPLYLKTQFVPRCI